MLILTRRPGESIRVGDEIIIRVLGVSGNHVRFGFIAPKHVAVHRQEVFEARQAEEREREAI